MTYPKHSRGAATNYVAEARPIPGGFLAYWAYPGIPPRPALDDDGQPIGFKTERAAFLHAAVELHKQLNERTWITGKPERYEHLTGPQLAIKLRDAGLTPTAFARIYGTAQARVMDWIDGVREPPHPVRVLLDLFIADPGLVAIAESVTARHTTERQPHKEPIASTDSIS